VSRFALAAVLCATSGCGLLIEQPVTSDAGTGLDAGAFDAGDRDAAARDAGPAPADGCVPAPERCDGEDQDCDGRIDEATEPRLCDPGSACVDGACVCDDGAMCGGACVDLAADPLHCGACGAACGGDAECVDGACCSVAPPPVDVLMVIDSSSSMAEEQDAFSALVRSIAVRWDGRFDPALPPLETVHLGVITADLGVGPAGPLPTCDAVGDDARLRTTASGPGCGATFPSFIDFRPGAGDGDRVEEHLRCVMRVGTGGCGFEQPLEAMLKALTPSTSPTRFFRGVTGLGDTANAGFLRPDSVLVVAIVTDEDDCSAMDPELYDPLSATFEEDLNLRCHAFPDALHEVERYRTGLAAIHPPADTVYLLVAGVPPDRVGDASRDILDDPRMVETIDASMPTRLVPSCSRAGSGVAFPPRRLVKLGAGLEDDGAAVIYGTVCGPDLGAPLDRTLSAIGARYRRECAME